MTANEYRMSIGHYLPPEAYRPTHRRAIALVGATEKIGVYPWQNLPDGTIAFMWVDADDDQHRRLYPMQKNNERPLFMS